jgi:hypothetical protein
MELFNPEEEAVRKIRDYELQAIYNRIFEDKDKMSFNHKMAEKSFREEAAIFGKIYANFLVKNYYPPCIRLGENETEEDILKLFNNKGSPVMKVKMTEDGKCVKPDRDQLSDIRQYENYIQERGQNMLKSELANLVSVAVDELKKGIKFMYNMGYTTYHGDRIPDIDKFLEGKAEEELREIFPRSPIYTPPIFDGYCPTCGRKTETNNGIG